MNEIIQDKFEFYLSKDIIQGEDVPFYLLWHDVDIECIEMHFDGFEKVLEYHNLVDNSYTEKLIIPCEALKKPGYFGGILKTTFSDEPFRKAKVVLKIKTRKGDPIEISEERTLYTTKMEVINIPDLIEWPCQEPPIIVELKGRTTVFIDIGNHKESEAHFELPEDIRNALDRFYTAFSEGLKKLKEEFPKYESFINLFLDLDDFTSELEFVEKIIEEIERIKHDQDFVEAFTMVFVNAFFVHSGLRDAYLRPLLEYFESNAAEKAFFQSPFLCVNAPEGVSCLKGFIYHEDLLEKREVKVEFETQIKSNEPNMIPIKKLFRLRRGK